MMKKLICVILVILISLLFTGCVLHTDDDNPKLDIHENAAYEGSIYDDDSAGDEDSFIFTWITYGEVAVTDTLRDKTAYEKYMGGLFENMKRAGITDCFVQVRPFADAIYPSELFPESIYAEKAEGFDPFGVIISVAEEHDIGIHAWINPYRISSKKLSEDSTYYQWYEDYRDDIIEVDSGVYFNPCSLKVQALILAGVDEIMREYPVKGIHIDDYFYPIDFGESDKAQYEFYRKNGGSMDISQWRRENVNALVSAIYLKVKAYGEDKIFSVSPSGNIEKNYSQLYADVDLWCKGGYCDMVLPQIYFGFENDALPFEECLEAWLSVTDRKNVTLIPGLALYKRGKVDEFAGSGKDEWTEKDDVVSRQIEAIRNKKLHGVALYSSSYINFSETFSLE